MAVSIFGDWLPYFLLENWTGYWSDSKLFDGLMASDSITRRIHAVI